MRVGEYCTREVAFATREMGVAEVARVMRSEHVGTVVVVDEENGARHPVGIVTDRDLVLEVLAAGLDPDAVSVGDLCTRALATACDDDDLMITLERMGSLGVRRMPVLDAEGALAGILAADDVMEVVGELCGHIATLFSREVAAEVRERPAATSAGRTLRA